MPARTVCLSCRGVVSAFHAIFSVVAYSSKKQVAGVDTRLYIAPMPHDLSFRYAAVVVLKNPSMSPDIAVGYMAKELAVASFATIPT